MSTYELGIDGSGAEAGAERIVKSFDAIKAAADRMEGGVSAAAKKASSSFADLQKNARPVSDAAIRSLKELSAAFTGFRAPSDAAVRNTIIFLQGLKSVGTLNLGRVTGLASLLSAISGYRGPSPSAGKNTLAVLNALRFVSTFSMPRGLTQMLGALSVFKGPSAAAARNVTALLTALNNFRAGPGLSASIRALNALTAAANSARSSLNSLRGAAPNTVIVKANTAQAQKGFGELIKSQSLLQSAIYRTQTAWNTLGGVLAAKFIIGAANSMIQMNAQLEAATGSARDAAYQFAFVTNLANKLGLEIKATASSYGFFLGSIKGTNMTLQESRTVFEGFSTAARALQLSTADVDGVFRALGQMMSKGKIQAEELRGQLGDRLPGAFTRFAVALKMTKPGELDQALKKGAVSGDKMKQAIIDVAKTLEVEFGPAADKMSKTVDAAFNRLRNAFTFTSDALGKSGMNEGIIKIADALTRFMQSDTLATLVGTLGDAFKILGDNIEVVASILGGLAVTSAVKWAVGMLEAAKAVTAVQVAMKGLTAMEMAMGLGSMTAQAGTLTRALRLLWAVILDNPYLVLGAAIAAALIAMSQFTDKTAEANRLVRQSADAANMAKDFEAAWENQLWSSSEALNDNIKKLQQKINLQIRSNQLTLAEGADIRRVHGILPGGLTFRSTEVTKSAPLSGSGIRPGEITLNGTRIDNPELARQLGGIITRGGNYYTPRNTGEAIQMAQQLGQLQYFADKIGGSQGEAVSKAILNRTAALSNIEDLSRRGQGYKGYADWAYKYRGLGTTTGEGITGGAPVQSGKKHGKSEAEKAQDDINNAIDQAMNGLTDLESRAKSTSESVGKLLSGSFDKAGAAAHIAAVDQEKSFEDAIKGPENKIKGVLQLAHQLGLDVSGKSVAEQYQSAKDAVIAYAEERQKAANEAKADEKVATDIIAQREDNRIQADVVNQLQMRGKSLAEVNRYQEIENELVGTSAEYHERMYPILKKEYEERDHLKGVMQLANDERAREKQLEVDAAQASMMMRGARQEDIDYYTDLIKYRQELLDTHPGNDPVVQSLLNSRAASLNAARANKELSDQYEKTKQSAADMADAIVGGFRDGLEAGNSFLSIFKNIFKQITKIVMDFVLYNPMKQMLQQMLTQTLAPLTVGGNSAGSPASGTVNSYSTSGSLVGSVIGAFSSLIGQRAGGEGGFVNTNQRNVSVSGGRGFLDSNGELVFPTLGATNSSDVIVTGIRNPSGTTGISPAVIPPPAKQMSFFSNFMRTMDESRAAMGTFKSWIKGGMPRGGATDAIGGALGAAGTAFAMYQTGNMIGKSVAKALGGGFRTQAVAGGITGGAAAGFSLGGPIGAAIGAVAGGILGFLKKKPKVPSSYGSVVVGSDGLAAVGTTGTYGKADAKIGQQAASAGSTLFNNFAATYGGSLNPGNYGTFGNRYFKLPGPNNNGNYSFWSALGVDKKGKPRGVQGKDWILGSDSEVQAFALLKEIRSGMIKGLSDTIMTVAKNTKATTMEGLQGDLDIGQAFDQFIKGSFILTDTASKMADLNEAFNKLKAQSKALGLSEDKLTKARARMVANLKDEFNFNINQGILAYTNPAMAAFNQLQKEYHDAVMDAMAVGGDLVAVEDLYGRRRAELAKQWADTATNGLKSAATDLYNSLTASSSSPLNQQTIFTNARGLYQGLTSQFAGGDFSNVGELNTFAQNYLDAARQMYGSSTDYFDIFKQVTDQLNLYSNGQGLPGLSGGPPELPQLDDVVEEINQQSLDMIEAVGTVGQAVVEGSTNVVDAINNLAIALGQNIPASTPTGPTSGATGVSSTGGVWTRFFDAGAGSRLTGDRILL